MRDLVGMESPKSKVETTPQYFYGLASLPTIPCGTYIITWHDRKLVQHNCDVHPVAFIRKCMLLYNYNYNGLMHLHVGGGVRMFLKW